MDSNFQKIVVIGLIIIGVIALILCYYVPSTQGVMTGIVSTCIGALAGVLQTPKPKQIEPPKGDIQ